MDDGRPAVDGNHRSSWRRRCREGRDASATAATSVGRDAVVTSAIDRVGVECRDALPCGVGAMRIVRGSTGMLRIVIGECSHELPLQVEGRTRGGVWTRQCRWSLRSTVPSATLVRSLQVTDTTYVGNQAGLAARTVSMKLPPTRHKSRPQRLSFRKTACCRRIVDYVRQSPMASSRHGKSA
jgi:hypothetical protein